MRIPRCTLNILTSVRRARQISVSKFIYVRISDGRRFIRSAHIGRTRERMHEHASPDADMVEQQFATAHNGWHCWQIDTSECTRPMRVRAMPARAPTLAASDNDYCFASTFNSTLVALAPEYTRRYVVRITDMNRAPDSCEVWATRRVVSVFIRQSVAGTLFGGVWDCVRDSPYSACHAIFPIK